MGYFCTSLMGVCRGDFFCMESEQWRGISLGGSARGRGGERQWRVCPLEGLGPQCCCDCQDLSGAAGSQTRGSVYESLCSVGCVKWKHSFRCDDTWGKSDSCWLFFIFIFCTFYLLLWVNHVPPPFISVVTGLLTWEWTLSWRSWGCQGETPCFVSLQCAWLAPFQERSCSILRCFLFPLKTYLKLQHVGFNSGLLKSVSSLKDRVIAAVLRKRVSGFSSGNKSTAWSTCFSGECSAHVNGM